MKSLRDILISSDAVINEINKFDLHIAELGDDVQLDKKWEFAEILSDLSEYFNFFNGRRVDGDIQNEYEAVLGA